MQDEITNGVVAVVKFIAYYIIWSFVLFNLGRVSLLLVTLGQYPRGHDAQRHVNQISFVGIFVLVLAWSAVAIYNNTHGIQA
ncbi:hypothetical protein ASD55_17835 [Rhodanobacter sp. Root561]|jgi:hypothetical protein|uniref:hypothetical protein n=1 Tax=Rhodanobacter sp. Root561 TaxID=1736560 RepID=UPI0006F55850|nr:hypothetical protein [Rhodanobacter sp. Root561]KQZ77877.1 hypothetical protein ASD55_17835 [Rhodanobacter sp. Root561]